MKTGQIQARHFATGQPIRARWEEGRIVEIQSLPPGSPVGWWIAPALVDLQINGFGGFDFQHDAVTLADLLTANRRLQEAGCAAWLLTLITDEWPRLICRIERLRHLRAQSPELQMALKGWHIEGPFLSAAPGFHGTHNPAFMCDPTPRHLQELRAVTGSDPVLLTLAPERTGALEAIEQAVSLGFKVSLGHTNVPAATLRQAVAAGATGFTHLGNGCPQLLDRHDNILWRVLDLPGLTISLIPDCLHVSPPLFRLIHRLRPPATIIYVTDAMSAAGAPPGLYRLGELQLEVGADQVVREPGKNNYAGSALRPIEGIFRAAAMLGAPWQSVWAAGSQRAAAFMGWHLNLEPGDEASFCLLKPAGENQLDRMQLYCRGELKVEERSLEHRFDAAIPAQAKDGLVMLQLPTDSPNVTTEEVRRIEAEGA
jgi:N-acetylglucosamine-6-phosphate deacetylase